MIRVAYTSDLHADLGARNAALLPHLAATAAALDPDVFIVAGDLAETAALVTASLRHFTPLRARKFYLAGNHDLYVEADGATSRDKFESTLPAAAAAAGFEYLGLDPVQVGPLAIVGVPGWYDYSMRVRSLDVVAHRDHYRAGRWRDVRAFDRGSVHWPREGATRLPAGAHPASNAGDWAGDEEIAACMQARLDAQLQGVTANVILGVIHVLPFEEHVVPGAFGDEDFHAAYLGSTALGARLQRDPRVRAVISGHQHRHADLQIGNIHAVARPVGNAANNDLPLPDLAASCIGLLELDLAETNS